MYVYEHAACTVHAHSPMHQHVANRMYIHVTLYVYTHMHASTYTYTCTRVYNYISTYVNLARSTLREVGGFACNETLWKRASQPFVKQRKLMNKQCHPLENLLIQWGSNANQWKT